jgi:hypothetical protein
LSKYSKKPKFLFKNFRDLVFTLYLYVSNFIHDPAVSGIMSVNFNDEKSVWFSATIIKFVFFFFSSPGSSFYAKFSIFRFAFGNFAFCFTREEIEAPSN